MYKRLVCSLIRIALSWRTSIQLHCTIGVMKPVREIAPILTVVESFAEAEAADRAYWWVRTPLERLRHTETLRQLNYGKRAAARLQRVLEVAERA
jgi:hypothetical protein